MGLLSWFYGEDAAREQIAETDRRLAIENAKDEARLGQEWADQVAANQRREAQELVITSGDEFYTGWNEAVAERRGQLGAVVSLPFKLVPWQLWLIGLAVLFWYVGGVAAVQRKVGKSA